MLPMYGANVKRRRTGDVTYYSVHYHCHMQAEDKQWGRNIMISLLHEPDNTCRHTVQGIQYHNIV